MKKFMMFIAVCAFAFVGIFTVFATNEHNYVLKGGATKMLAENLEGNAHSTVYSRDIDKSTITVYNKISQKRSSGNTYETIGETNLYVSCEDCALHYNFYLSRYALTRSSWKNQTANSNLYGDFYIESNHMNS